MTSYYDDHYQEYFDNTFFVDPSGFLGLLSKYLKTGATILDVGCGSGRDIAWLKSRGFNPLGFERSSGLAELARRNSGCDVIEGDFETFDFGQTMVDVILLVTALVHVPRKRFSVVLENIRNGLNRGGWMLLSVKEGVGIDEDEKGRRFYLWQRDELETVLVGMGFQIIETNIVKSVLNNNESIISILMQDS